MNNIRLMIVDDEFLALDNIRTLVDWRSFGYEIVATASNGKQAISKYDLYKPQVIISDIDMPMMDGIELTELIKQRDESAVVILLTAYAEVDYLKSAFQNGVQDYLIKDEITPELLKAKFLKIKEHLEKSLHHERLDLRNELEVFFRTSDREMPKVKEKFLPLLLYDDCDLPFLDVVFPRQDKTFPAASENLKRFCEHMEEGWVCVRFTIALPDNKYLLFITPPNGGSSLLNTGRDLLYFSENLIKLLKKEFSRSFTVFMSTVPMDIMKIRDFMHSHLSETNVKYLLGTGRVYEFSGIQVQRKEVFDKSLVTVIDAGSSPERICSQLASLSSSLKVCGTYNDLLFVSEQLTDALRRFGLSPVRCEPLRNIDEIFTWFGHMFMDAADLLKKNSNISREIQRAIRFIEKHYSDASLSLPQIALYVGLSQARLCTLFKNEMGITLWEYLTEYRIERAKKLLTEGECKIYEVADSVGYSTGQYFSQVFLRLTGHTPANYKKEMALKPEGHNAFIIQSK